MASYFEYFRKRSLPIIRSEGLVAYFKKSFALLATFAAKRTLNKDNVRDEFFKLYYLSEKDQAWLGARAEKCPTDAWAYQELIFRTKPDFIIETGTCEGGGALFFASILDMIGKGKVITVDVEKHCTLSHPRVIQLTGSSTSEDVVKKIGSLVKGKTTLVSLDSDHSKKNVLKEMELYSEFVRTDGYMVVEDTCINGHPVMPGWGEGPLEAVTEFLSKRTDFVQDRECEKFLLSYNRGGFLKRIK